MGSINIWAHRLLLALAQSSRQIAMEEKYRKQAYQLANIGHWEFDAVSKDLYWSDEINRLHEVSPDYQPDLDDAINFYEEGKHRNKVSAVMSRAIEKGKPFTIESKIITNKGNVRWIRAIGKPEMKNGKCVRVLGSTQDITAQKKANQQAQQARQQLQNIVEHSTIMFYRHDTDHWLTYVSPQSNSFLGCPPEQAKQQWTEFITDHPKNQKGLKLTAKALKTGQTQPSYELQLERTDGKIIWVQVNESPVVENGETVGIVGSLTNITSLKEKQQELDKLSRVARQTQNMVIITDPNEHIEWVNDAFTRITGYQKKEVIGKNPGNLLQGQDTDPETIRRIARKIDAGQAFSEEILNYTKDGQSYWLKIDITPITGEDGEVLQYFSIQEDITQRKKAERALEEKEAQLRNIANNIDGMVHRYRRYPDGSYEFIYVSEGVKRLHEVTPEQVLESPDLLWAQITDDHIDRVKYSVDESAKQLTPWNQKWKIETPSGQQKWIHGRGTPKQCDDGSVQWDTILLDVTEQRRLEQNISSQVSLLNNILDSIPGLFYMIGEDLTFARTNRNVETLFDLTSEQLQTTNVLSLVAPRERTKTEKILRKAFREGYAELETILIGRDNEEYHYYMTGNRIVLDGTHYVIGMGIDITQRIKAEKENTILLQEIHHRVRNNLAIISGILNLELEESTDNFNRLPLERSVNRIHSIAKVHELLYKTSSFSQINIKEYISELATTITGTLQAEDHIDIQLKIDDIAMNINELIPMGMLLNELFTNSLKYAFREKDSGLITLEITQTGEGYDVHYSDNGRGFDLADFENSTTLGFTIVNMLLKQLEATSQLNTNDGFDIKFSFQEKETGSHSNIIN